MCGLQRPFSGRRRPATLARVRLLVAVQAGGMAVTLPAVAAAVLTLVGLKVSLVRIDLAVQLAAPRLHQHLLLLLGVLLILIRVCLYLHTLLRHLAGVHLLIGSEEGLVRLDLQLVGCQVRWVIRIFLHTGDGELGADLRPLHHILDGLRVQLHRDEVCAQGVRLRHRQLRLRVLHPEPGPR